MAFWKPKLEKPHKQPKATPADNHTNSRLLQLPAELRLQIYSYIIYPYLQQISIARDAPEWRPIAKVLSPSIFSTSHQLRAEALSYLVREKPLRICEIETANALFHAIGSKAIADIRSLSIAQVLTNKPLPQEQIKRFARFLDQATSLQYLSLEAGLFGKKQDHEVNFDQNMLFFEKVFAFAKGRPEMEFRWTAGNANSQLCECKQWENVIKLIYEAHGDGNREALRDVKINGQMYLW